MNKYLIAFTKYKSYFSLETEIATYCAEAENMKTAVEKVKNIYSVLNIIAISQIDESINWEDLD